MNEVRRLRFLDGSLPMKSVRFWIPFLYLSSASCIQRSNTGLIFWALLGVMSNFSNLKIEEIVCEDQGETSVIDNKAKFFYFKNQENFIFLCQNFQNMNFNF